MTLATLAVAAAAGFAVGLVGAILMPATAAARLIAVAVGMIAAVLGTLAARTVAPSADGRAFDVAGPALFAVIGVAVSVAGARRRGPDRPPPPPAN